LTLEGNWDFETGDLTSWTAKGDAFHNQPVHGDSITTARVRPVTLGGDYWDVPYFIGHHGNYWIGTAENPLGDTATGTLTSQEFLLSQRYICFLISGTQDLNTIRVELQVRLEDYECIYAYGRDSQAREEHLKTLSKLPAVLHLDTGFAVVLRATGHNSEIMRQECWDVTALLSVSRAAHVPLQARIKIIDISEAGHVNVDHFQFLDAVPQPEQPLVWGFADLHCHPMVHLAFGGKLIWGRPTDPIQKLRHCDGSGHGGGLFSGRILHDIEAKDDPRYGASKHASGYWPTFSSRSHQEMHIDWIRRAYEGGLRLMCAHAVNNQLLEHLMRATPFLSIKPKDDVQVVLQQTEAMKELAACYADWMCIAYSPLEARQIIAEGKLAVVLGVEVDQLGGWKCEEDCTDQQVAALLHMLYTQGIRMLTPIHLADNAFGGSALYETMFNGLNYYLNGKYYDVEDGYEAGVHFRLEERPEKVIFERLFPRPIREDQPIAAYTCIPPGHGHMNKKGLTARGCFLVQAMMRMGMMLDIDHMSQKATQDTLAIAEQYDYPVVSSHTSFRELARHGASEVSKTQEQIAKIQRLGGIIAPIVNPGNVRNVSELVPRFADRVPNDYPESSKSWAQAYLYAVELMKGKGVALGTDLNGFPSKPRPRFGGNDVRTGGTDDLRLVQRNGVRYAHYDQTHERYKREAIASGSLERLQVPLTAHDGGAYDINTMGLAHYGMLPDFLQDASNVGLTDSDMAPLFRSAEDYIQMWEKCECKSKANRSRLFP
jgi:microsomal dipeptidase-like Zn-dependent dipeptidase